MGIIAEQWVAGQRVHLTVHRATGLRRLTGLIGRPEPAGATALRFTRCRSVHSALMSRPIDVVFADAVGCVLEVRSLPPWRLVWCGRAAQTFELRSGEASRLGITPGVHMIQIDPEEGIQ